MASYIELEHSANIPTPISEATGRYSNPTSEISQESSMREFILSNLKISKSKEDSGTFSRHASFELEGPVIKICYSALVLLKILSSALFFPKSNQPIKLKINLFSVYNKLMN